MVGEVGIGLRLRMDRLWSALSRCYGRSSGGSTRTEKITRRKVLYETRNKFRLWKESENRRIGWTRATGSAGLFERGQRTTLAGGDTVSRQRRRHGHPNDGGARPRTRTHRTRLFRRLCHRELVHNGPGLPRQLRHGDLVWSLQQRRVRSLVFRLGGVARRWGSN